MLGEVAANLQGMLASRSESSLDSGDCKLVAIQTTLRSRQGRN